MKKVEPSEGKEENEDKSPVHHDVERPYVLWCLKLREEDSSDFTKTTPDRYIYKDRPWKNINNGLPGSDPDHYEEDDDHETRETNAVLLYRVTATVRDKTHKSGNTPSTWRDEPIDFQFGVDAKLLYSSTPTIFLYSERLIKIMKLLLAYYPDYTGDFVQYEVDRDEYGVDRDHTGVERDHYGPQKDSFVEFMYYYPELKAYFNTYIRSLPTDQLLDPRLDIGDCGDEETAQAIQMILNFEGLNLEIEQCDEATAYDLAVLLRLLAPMYRVQVVPTMTSRLLSPEPLVRYDKLWLLMRPGTLVYFQPPMSVETHRRAYVVASCSYKLASDAPWDDMQKPERVSRFEVDMWGIQYNKTFRRVSHRATFPVFEGLRAIKTLQVIPSDVHDRLDGGKLRRKLEKRGQNYISILREPAAHREYNSPHSAHSGDIIVDPEAYKEYSEDYSHFDRDSDKGMLAGAGTRNRFREFIDLTLSNSKTFARINDVYVLLPRTVEGLVLRTKKWMEFEIDYISERTPARSTNQLENELVLVSDADKESLRTVLSKGEKFVGHGSDFVQGKGEGQIFLLYGPPGTGKTLTVECVANDTGRPLLTLTAQDVGLATDMDTERKLQQWFTLAAKWDAILLIDEADLFLEQRREGSLDRNSLSTVFLRTMEYYEGVLFLTTNRAGHIDDSFISRITCPIAYPALSPDTKSRIIRKFIRKYGETGTIDVQPQAETYMIEHCAELNGRQIRNVLQNAVAMAEVQQRWQRKSAHQNGLAGQQQLPKIEMVSVKWHHVKAAIERQINFMLYLNNLKGRDEGTRARSKHDYLLAPPTSRGRED